MAQKPLEERIQWLDDESALKRLLAHSSRLLDAKNVHAQTQLFTEDALDTLLGGL